MEYKREVIGGGDSCYVFRNAPLTVDKVYCFENDSVCWPQSEYKAFYYCRHDSLFMTDTDIPEFRVLLESYTFTIRKAELILDEVAAHEQIAYRHFFRQIRRYKSFADPYNQYDASSDHKATFKGGNDSLLNFIYKEQGLKTYDKGISCERIEIKIYVDENGKIRHAENYSLHPSKVALAKAMRIVEHMPDWIAPEVEYVVDYKTYALQSQKIKSVQVLEIPILSP